MTKRASLSYHLGFNAQHSPMGAFMSFTCGNFGTRGGIGLQIGQPGDQEVFIGFKDGDRYSDATLKCLPFYTAAVNRAADAFPGGAGRPRRSRTSSRTLCHSRKANSRAPMAGPAIEWQAEGMTLFGLFAVRSDS